MSFNFVALLGILLRKCNFDFTNAPAVSRSYERYNIMVGFVCIIKQYQFDFCNLRYTYSAPPVSRSCTNSICYLSRLYKCMVFLARHLFQRC
jgi:hypothetical protein